MVLPVHYMVTCQIFQMVYKYPFIFLVIEKQNDSKVSCSRMRHSDFVRALIYKSQSVWNVNIVISLTVIFTCMFKKLICMFIGQFGSLVWSASEKYLLYVAEKKLPKAVSYFEKQKGKVYMQLFWEKWTEKKGKSACKTHSTSHELHN